MSIYKILRADEWAALRKNRTTDGAPVDLADGYVHFSAEDQVRETAAKHFAGEEGLMLLAVDELRLGEALRWEPSRGGDLFPHLYGPLLLEAVEWAQPLPWDGTAHRFPEGFA